MKRRRDDRTTHCKRGHSLADAFVDSKGHRQCRTCSTERVRRQRDGLGYIDKPRRQFIAPIMLEWPLSVCAELPLDSRPYVGVNR